MTKKAVNAGVDALTGFALQRNIALYLILSNYDTKFKDANYFVCIEHHDDCLLCFLSDKNELEFIESYQSKKKSPDKWTLNKDLLEIIIKILQTGKDIYEDTSLNKTKDYSHCLFFVSNQTISLSVPKHKGSVCVKEDNTNIQYSNLPDIIKEHIRSNIADTKLHTELDNFNILWIDLNRTVEKQENELIGQIVRLFGDKIEYPKAALNTILELFRKIETRYNNGSIVKLLDESKRVYSKDINDAFDIITTKSKCFNYWREQKEDICQKLKIKVIDQDAFKFNFESAFDYFKCPAKLEHKNILDFTINTIDSVEAYNKIDLVNGLILQFNKSHRTNLTDIQLKSSFFAAMFEALNKK